jgi:uncharacterized protein YqeY
MLKQQLERDLKVALLAGDKERATVIRSLKSVILYAEVAKGVRDDGLGDAEIIELFAKEAKKRQESADLYIKGGSEDRAALELAEKKIIEGYLPQQLSEEELVAIIDQTVTDIDATGLQVMGMVIGKVKQLTSGRADGARIAALVKERLVK